MVFVCGVPSFSCLTPRFWRSEEFSKYSEMFLKYSEERESDFVSHFKVNNSMEWEYHFKTTTKEKEILAVQLRTRRNFETAWRSEIRLEDLTRATQATKKRRKETKKKKKKCIYSILNFASSRILESRLACLNRLVQVFETLTSKNVTQSLEPGPIAWHRVSSL